VHQHKLGNAVGSDLFWGSSNSHHIHSYTTGAKVANEVKDQEMHTTGSSSILQKHLCVFVIAPDATCSVYTLGGTSFDSRQSPTVHRNS
jgi:hypothetical protein